ncbi:hypothetical protein NC797_05550 [Aquibacillus sp. 3ASR75-11]|uniref:Alpha/beta hydrolase family protein n=1 Tax=Terrihalobacillus insolitus TaxID=2950438 RepID=A0A9X4AL77_9BACI|nr:hypothetical protein [Terrihalobacillus insolitus]MDC3412620.1 hypothetical protein [Terrihalobacillus insolitus]MDC3423971.1 hypothetical protein [Terrihalobacillus insolitus]
MWQENYNALWEWGKSIDIIETPITLIQGKEDSDSSLSEWNKLTLGETRALKTLGNHYTMMNTSNIKFLGELVQSLIDQKI